MNSNATLTRFWAFLTDSVPSSHGRSALRPWDDGTESVKNAQKRVKVAFEFMEKLGAPYYAFHDRDHERRSTVRRVFP